QQDPAVRVEPDRPVADVAPLVFQAPGGAEVALAVPVDGTGRGTPQPVPVPVVVLVGLVPGELPVFQGGYPVAVGAVRGVRFGTAAGHHSLAQVRSEVVIMHGSSPTSASKIFRNCPSRSDPSTTSESVTPARAGSIWSAMVNTGHTTRGPPLACTAAYASPPSHKPTRRIFLVTVVISGGSPSASQLVSPYRYPLLPATRIG